jgi:hypothetical protein
MDERPGADSHGCTGGIPKEFPSRNWSTIAPTLEKVSLPSTVPSMSPALVNVVLRTTTAAMTSARQTLRIVHLPEKRSLVHEWRRRVEAAGGRLAFDAAIEGNSDVYV